MPKYAIHTPSATYTFEEVKNKAYYEEDDYFQSALDFCSTWLNHQQKFVVHTSGSTGKPKAIAITRQQMQASTQLSNKVLDLENTNTALVAIHTGYIGGKMMLVRGLEFGWEMYLEKPSSNPLENFDKQIDFTALVPLQVLEILANKATKTRFNQIKQAIIGGAEVSYKLLQQLQELKTIIYHTYGMTETVSHIALKRLNGENPDAYFQAIEGVAISKNEKNCLVIYTPTSSEVVITNDLVEIMGKNTFKILGRVDNVINSGGVKIQLEEVEQQIEQIMFEQNISLRYYTLGEPHPKWGQMLTLYIESEKELPQLEEQLKQKLPNYHYPKKIIYLSKFQETESGKIKRVAKS